MTQRNQAVLDKVAESSVVRLLLVIGTTLVIAAASPLLFLSPLANIPWLLKYAVISALGIVSAITTCIILANHTFVLQFLTAMVALLAGLFLVRRLSNGYIGVSPNPTMVIEWDGLAQLGLATTISWLVLRIVKKSVRQQKQSPTPKPLKITQKSIPKSQKVKISSGVRNKMRPSGSSHSTKRPNVKGSSTHPWLPFKAWRQSWSASIKQVKKTAKRLRMNAGRLFLTQSPWAMGKFPRLRSKANTQGSKVISSQPFDAQSQKRKKLPVKTHQVRLLSQEEHRCPYCLEIVHENDPRGVKICPICGTYHHADCWAVTGVCQVPHQHE